MVPTVIWAKLPEKNGEQESPFFYNQFMCGDTRQVSCRTSWRVSITLGGEKGLTIKL